MKLACNRLKDVISGVGDQGAALTTNRIMGAWSMPKVALQLSTLQDIAQMDVLGAIEKAGELHYPAIEFSGYFGAKPSEVRRVLEEYQLEAVSNHFSIDWGNLKSLGKDLAREIHYAQEIGIPRLVMPWVPLQEKPVMEDVQHVIKVVERAALQVNASGLKFGFHNHVSEFIHVDGKMIMDHILDSIPPELLFLELDVGWVYMAGLLPADLVRCYGSRLELIHFRDFGTQRTDTVIGEGVIHFDPVLREAAQTGVQYYVVTQEQFELSSIDSAKLSLQFFQERELV